MYKTWKILTDNVYHKGCENDHPAPAAVRGCCLFVRVAFRRRRRVFHQIFLVIFNDFLLVGHHRCSWNLRIAPVFAAKASHRDTEGGRKKDFLFLQGAYTYEKRERCEYKTTVEPEKNTEKLNCHSLYKHFVKMVIRCSKAVLPRPSAQPVLPKTSDTNTKSYVGHSANFRKTMTRERLSHRRL